MPNSTASQFLPLSGSVRLISQALVCMLFCAALAGCGSDSTPGAPIASPPPVDTTPPPPPAPDPEPEPEPDRTALSGDPEASALASVVDIDFPAPVPGRINAAGVVLTQLGVLFSLDASVGEVNDALAAIEANIAYARQGSLLMVLEVERQPTAGRMLELAEVLRGQAGVASAWTERVAAPHVLPRRANGTPANPADLEHLLPTRFPAAWNAAGLLAGCEARPVRVIVVDYFNEAAPADFFSFFPAGSMVVDAIEREVDDDEEIRRRRLIEGEHGYLVTLAMAGNHDGEIPTGAHPRAACLRVEQLDVPSRPGKELLDALQTRLQDGAQKTVVQMSIGDSIDMCGAEGDEACAADFAELTQARVQNILRRRIGEHLHWATSGLTPANAEQVLFTVSAGNEADEPIGEAYAGFRDARFSLFPQAVAQLPILRAVYANESFGIDLWSPLTSTGDVRPGLPSGHLPLDELEGFQLQFDALDKDALVGVGNFLTVGATGPQSFDTFPADGRGLPRTTFSNDGALVHAVGQDMRLGLPDSDSGVDIHRGTSYAAPQVAGLAAYLWLLSDELRAQPAEATRNHLLATAQRFTTGDVQDRSNEAGINDIVDAYAAVLALDRPGEPKRVRLAILDINGDGQFTETDLEAFLDGFAQFGADDADRAPDFSRFDLNGDGFTGGGLMTGMDLDAENYDLAGRPVLEQVSIFIDGVPRTFDERFLTDLDALCYLAYEPTLVPYTGSAQRRTELLGPDRCAPLSVSVVFPQTFSGNADLDVLVTRPVPDNNAGESQEPVPGIRLRIVATCATVSSAEVLTDDNGRAGVNVIAQEGCTSVELRIEVLGEDDLVARTVNVSANVVTGEERWEASWTFDASRERADGRPSFTRANGSASFVRTASGGLVAVSVVGSEERRFVIASGAGICEERLNVNFIEAFFGPGSLTSAASLSFDASGSSTTECDNGDSFSNDVFDLATGPNCRPEAQGGSIDHFACSQNRQFVDEGEQVSVIEQVDIRRVQ